MLKISFRNQVLIGFTISFLLVFGISFYSYKSIINLEDDKFKIEHTEQVIGVSDELLKQLINAETGQRGYVITGVKHFLEPYNSSINQIRPTIDKFRALTVDNLSQQGNIDSIETNSTRKLNEMALIIDLYDTQGFAAAQERIHSERGKFYMDQCRIYLNRIVSQENALLNQRRVKSVRSIYSSIQAIVIGGILFTAVICVLFYVIRRFFTRQKEYEERIIESNKKLESILTENEAKNWVLTGLGKVNEVTQGEQSEAEMAAQIIRTIGNYTTASLGTFYFYDEKSNLLNYKAGYAISDVKSIPKNLSPGKNWMGQTIIEGGIIELKGLGNPNIKFESSLISGAVMYTYIVPFYFQKKLIGIMEMAYSEIHNPSTKAFLKQVAQTNGESIHTAQARTLLQLLYEQTQQQSEELEAHQEELRTTNEELVYKTKMLQASEEELQVQQDELTTVNIDLEEKAHLLEERNRVIEEARADIARKMDELEKTGRYKSEFLANMSHELRTPLNSILVLARILKDNQKQNLNTDQVKYADVIFKAGSDLLILINDILDLTKIESGKMELEIEQIQISEIAGNMRNLFAEIASNKNINFIQINKYKTGSIQTDRLRVEQVLKNLLSNAFKFTKDGGEIALIFEQENDLLHISVEDNGIGIPPEKQHLIFEAFQQADGSTSRKYGGTGLGLSISRELSIILNGKISLKSTMGQGSVFTLTLPLKVEITRQKTENDHTHQPVQIRMPLPVPDKNWPEKPLLLIVEDDEQFAVILDNYARDNGYRTALLHAGNQVTEKVRELAPSAIVLDVMLPGKDGWQILKELKADEKLAHIPVHMMSAGDTTGKKVRQAGALSFLKKPITKETLDELFGQTLASFTDKKVLLIEDHEIQGSILRNLFQKQNIQVQQAYTGKEALNLLAEKEFTCVVLDLNLPDIAGLDLLDKIKSDKKFQDLPVIINTAMELDKAANERLARHANATILKSNKSSERLIDEVNLFLHKLKSDNSDQRYGKNNILINASRATIGQEVLKNKRVLLVDDDMRNIFALSAALQLHSMDIEIANDGMEALEKLNTISSFDVILMDMMMPRMDGYTCMQKIRQLVQFKKLPIIALTAKATKDDRERYIEAGANDYITKPIDVDMLVNLLQVWIK